MFLANFSLAALVGTYIVASHREQYLLPLIVGPLLGAAVYVLEYGFDDPSWFALLAVLAIGMMAGTPVTVAWMLFRGRR